MKNEVVEIDPRAFQDPRYGEAVQGSTREERIALVRLIVADLQQHPLGRDPLSRKYPHPMWNRLRSAPINERTTVEKLLTRPQVDNPLFELGRLIVLLSNAREQRAELVQRLASLDALEAAFGAEPAEAIRQRAANEHARIEALDRA